MWGDTQAPPGAPQAERDIHYSPRLRCDDAVWRDCICRMAEAGMNMVVIDVGDGVRYRSHPEISVEGAWSPQKLAEELDFCRERGVEPVPKLNFSACHDAWLGDYSRKVSTAEYYALCRDLIEETCDLFDGPRLFHLGMDEETCGHQRRLLYVVVRQGELWWHDLNLLVDAVEASGARAWVWSDVLWHCERDVFAKNMPRSVIQSNWYYSPDFPLVDAPNSLKAFDWLAEMGWEQIPTGSTWSSEDNYPRLVRHCTERIPPEGLLGFMMADWRPTTEPWREVHSKAIRVVASAHGE